MTLPRTRDGIWLRVLLSSADTEQHQKTLAVRRTFYEKFEVFVPTPTGYQRTSIGFDHFENGTSPKANHNHIDITVFPLEQHPVYIYVEDSLTVRVALEIWSPQALRQHDTQKTIFMTAIASIILALALYNLSLYTLLRDVTYLHYVAYMVALCTFLMTLETATYHIPWLSWPSWGTQEMVIFACLAAVTAAHFNQSFVNLAHYTPQLNKVISGCKVFLLAIAAICLLNIRTLDTVVTGLHNWIELALAPLLVIASVSAMRQGSRQARFFLAGWIFILTATFIAVLSALGFIGQNALTLYGLHVAAALEALILSIGLADRISSLKKEKARAEQLTRESDERIAQERKHCHSADTVTRYLASIHSQSSEEQVYLNLVATLGEVMGIRRCALLHGSYGSIRIHTNNRKLEEFFSLEISGRIKLLERVASEGEAMLLQNSSAEPHPLMIQQNNSCHAAIPLYCWRQEWSVILISPETESEFSNLQLRQATAFSETVKEQILNYRRYRASINGDELDPSGALSSTSLLKYAQRTMRQWQKKGEPQSCAILHIKESRFANHSSATDVQLEVLKAIIECCQNWLERSDICGRYSNDKLLILLPSSDLQITERLCRRIHQNVMELLESRYGSDLKVDIFCSIAPQLDATDTLDKLVRNATPIVLNQQIKSSEATLLS